MSTPTPKMKLALPSDVEKFDVDTFNNNMKIIDDSVPEYIIPGKPASKRLKIFKSKVFVNSGAGGDKRDASPATDVGGVGGIWLGYGIPAFEGIAYVNITDGGSLGPFQAEWSVLDANTTRIRFRGKRLEGGGWANGYGSMWLYVEIVGW